MELVTACMRNIEKMAFGKHPLDPAGQEVPKEAMYRP